MSINVDLIKMIHAYNNIYNKIHILPTVITYCSIITKTMSAELSLKTLPIV